MQSRDEQVRSAVHKFLAAQEIGQVADLLEQAALAQVARVAQANGLTVHELTAVAELPESDVAQAMQLQSGTVRQEWEIPALLDDLEDLVRLMVHTTRS